LIPIAIRIELLICLEPGIWKLASAELPEAVFIFNWAAAGLSGDVFIFTGVSAGLSGDVFIFTRLSAGLRKTVEYPDVY